MSDVWTNRIVGHAEVDPETLLLHPLNWRVQRPQQKSALHDSLNKLHMVKSVLVNQRTGRIIDGHKRVLIAREMGQPSVPVEYVDLSEEEEALALTVLDAITEMSGVSQEDLSNLLQEVVVEEEFGGLLALLDSLARKADLPGTEMLAFDDERGESRQTTIAPAQGAAPVPPARERTTNEAEHLKSIQIFMSVLQHEMFVSHVSELAEHFETDNTTDTVLRAVEYAFYQLVATS